MKNKWLKKAPNSITDLWKIIKEAEELYEQNKSDKRSIKKRYEDALLKQGVFVGSIVQVIDDDPGLKDHHFEVLSIRRNKVRVKNIKTGKTWGLTNFIYKPVKKNETK